jgi:predicted nuclease of predicted toxin-antitoxin system
MKILIDMNLSPGWVEVFRQQGWEAIHWSSVGDARATDAMITEWARAHQYVLFTHDLDFGAILATSRSEGPSVIQVRAQDVMPHGLGPRLVNIMRRYQSLLESGALITVDEARARLRILPIDRSRDGKVR